MHQSSLDRCREFVEQHLAGCPSLKLADVGSCDVNGSYRPLLTRDGWEYTGFDIAPGRNVDVVLGDEQWSKYESRFDGVFDVVLSGQCVEHVRKPWQWILRVARLVRPGGLVWLAAPNTWAFHEHPIDCWRVWPDGMRALFDEAGLIEVACGFVGADTIGIARKRSHESSADFVSSRVG